MAPASFHRKWPQGDEELRSNVYQIYKPFFSFFSEGGLKLWSHGEKGGPATQREFRGVNPLIFNFEAKKSEHGLHFHIVQEVGNSILRVCHQIG